MLLFVAHNRVLMTAAIWSWCRRSVSAPGTDTISRRQLSFGHRVRDGASTAWCAPPAECRGGFMY